MIQANSEPLQGPLLPQIETESAEFNSVSELLQREAGVDPSKCLKVRVVAGDIRTPLRVLFSGLQSLLWITPELGEYREHDESLHWPGVRKLHPQSVNVVIWAAAVGMQLLEANERQAAVDVGNAIDFFVDRGSNPQRYGRLISLCRVDVATVPDYGVQEAHNLRMEEVVWELPDLQPVTTTWPT